MRSIEVYVAFIDLEKVYNKVRRELWRLLHEYRVDVYLFRSMCSLHDGSKECVRVGSRVGEYFQVRRGVRRVCNVSVALQYFL